MKKPAYGLPIAVNYRFRLNHIWCNSVYFWLLNKKKRTVCCSTHQAIEYHNYKLMYESVQPISGEPVFKVTSHRFRHVTVDVTQTKSVGKQFVVFVATQAGEVMKLAILPHFVGACLVEVWKLGDEEKDIDVQAMQFVKETVSNKKKN